MNGREIAFEKPSIRAEYTRRGAEAFYRESGDSYRNPHEAQINAILRESILRWKPDLKNVLDLAAGSGEVTLVLRDLGAKQITGIDPFTFDAYESRTGSSCKNLTFDQIAAGAISDRRFNLTVCSFAMHLCPASRLAALSLQLSLISPDMIIVTPHKRPVIRSEWGWNLQDEFILNRVRARRYRSLHFPNT